MPAEHPSCPQEVRDLVERFRDNKAHYKDASYNETETRREFIDPLFKALGWDIDNSKGYAEAYKEVVHEDAIKVAGSTKAPDYGFRIGGARKFFVEAKKPSVNLNIQPEPAFQLRRYAWSAKLPLSILTDFEELAVYDTRVRPKKSDPASASRTLYFTFDQYESKWGEIHAIFSRDAILKGAFDKYAESKKKRGTTEVDDAFLETIREWREKLAKDILKHNDLSERALNQTVQTLIDRILFLRIAEDRGTEDANRLKKLQTADAIYDRLFGFFQDADRRYNSGLFHFDTEKGRPSEPDTIAPKLTVSNTVLKKIIDDLYYPSPYDFRVFPPDVLGQVYERFLGDVITLSKSGKSLKIEPKPEVRRAGGVYYTPTYIVDYIVEHTVGELVKGKAPHEIAGRTEKTFKPAKGAHPIRVLDPACGSGSFLLGAYQFLLDWYRDEYSKEPDRWSKGPDATLWQAGDNDYRLTIAERKRILTDHIYGVDIDRQAVEVSKLSLLLKCLEGENSDSIGAHLFHMKERALPDLAGNIKCGNSLIAPDFYDDKDPADFTTEDHLRINAFDWKNEFKAIFRSGGFDAAIGNPPYVKLQTSLGTESKYLSKNYAAATGNYDIYCLFVELAFKFLSPQGQMGQIVPHRFLKTDYGTGLRDLLLETASIQEITDFDGFMVFPGASINTCILLAEHKNHDCFQYRRVRKHALTLPEIQDLLDLSPSPAMEHGRVDFGSLNSGRSWVFIRQEEQSLWQKLQAIPHRLADLTSEIFQGLKTGADSVFIGNGKNTTTKEIAEFQSRIDDQIYPLESSLLFPLVKGGNMRPYRLLPTERLVLFPYENGTLLEWEVISDKYPLAAQYLEKHRDILERRDRGRMRGPTWFGYSRNQALTNVRHCKILVPDYYSHASYCYDARGTAMFCGGGAGGYGIVPLHTENAIYLMACLNSSLLDWYIQKVSMRAFQTAYMYTKKYLVQLPVLSTAGEPDIRRSVQDSIASCGQRMIELHSKRDAQTAGPDERRILQQQIDATDRKIDELVYQLYNLTDEEIAIVEAATAPPASDDG